jgi:hypothetical protein
MAGSRPTIAGSALRPGYCRIAGASRSRRPMDPSPFPKAPGSRSRRRGRTTTRTGRLTGRRFTIRPEETDTTACGDSASTQAPTGRWASLSRRTIFTGVCPLRMEVGRRPEAESDWRSSKLRVTSGGCPVRTGADAVAPPVRPPQSTDSWRDRQGIPGNSRSPRDAEGGGGVRGRRNAGAGSTVAAGLATGGGSFLESPAMELAVWGHRAAGFDRPGGFALQDPGRRHGAGSRLRRLEGQLRMISSGGTEGSPSGASLTRKRRPSAEGW